MNDVRIILASQSPWRRELLGRLVTDFECQPADVDESELKGEGPLAYVKRVARAKALAVAKKNPGAVVVAADTPVIVGRRILQTPQTNEEARAMLQLQSGRKVRVATVVVVVDAGGRVREKVCDSWFKMKRLGHEEVEAYVVGGGWKKCSGALCFEHMEHWVSELHGSYTGVR